MMVIDILQYHNHCRRDIIKVHKENHLARLPAIIPPKTRANIIPWVSAGLFEIRVIGLARL
ncbi:MAG: hypothetical protein WA421_05205 [Nitrososphaeraceae archaeon]|jgi:hypothetical protein